MSDLIHAKLRVMKYPEIDSIVKAVERISFSIKESNFGSAKKQLWNLQLDLNLLCNNGYHIVQGEVTDE